MKRKKGRSRRDGEEGGADEEAKKAKAIPDICDDVLLGIFSRLTFRDAARCITLSKRHRQLICGMDFWHLHRRLGPPLPRLHIAYMATIDASDPKSNRRLAAAAPLVPVVPGSVFLDFHLAGGGLVAGLPGNNNDDLRYSLIDRQRRYRRYVGTCNGVILMAQNIGGASILLFNPAVAGSEEEVDLELPEPGCRYRVVGFGYGPSSRRHKLLLTREELYSPDEPHRGMCYRAKELFVYTLGSAANQPRLRSVRSKLDAKISATSVYLDGKIYLLADRSRVLAFDVDSDTVTAIDLPHGSLLKRSKLVEVSGRLCVATGSVHLSLWLLAAENQWVRLGCELWCGGSAAKLTGAWDCGGVLLLYLRDRSTNGAYLHLFDTRDEAGTFRLRLLVPRPVVARPPEQGGSSAELIMCWGYRPTLVSPGSIVDAPPRRRSGGGVVAALKPLLERDVNEGRERTLESVCFMNLLLYIMTKLPDNMDDVIKELKRRSLLLRETDD